ncbi:uncharacterized protein TNCV_3004051 [Trichonephila clavipes]|nr:uncharacterized protein TNCV_3004051 [Trichonephila clavipes]
MDLDDAQSELSLLLKLKIDLGVQRFNRRKLRMAKAASCAPIMDQMHSKFVSNFSLLSLDSRSDCNSNEENRESSFDYSRRSLLRKGIRFFDQGASSPSGFHMCNAQRRPKPYDILLKKPLRIEPTVKDIPAADKDNPLTVSKEDSGDKSNQNGSVKSQSYPVSSGSSIICLDGLEISKLDFEEDCSGRCDIDTVSQRISKLHVN